MRIGEIAALVGVTSRAIRHYHHIGLLPEPGRRANGYRVYGVRDAVALARIRRLTELGLALDEVRDVLADDDGRELADILVELDADLARQEREIRERRRRLARLLDGASDTGKSLPHALAELLGTAPGIGSPTAARDREHLVLLNTVTDDAFSGALRPLTGDPGVYALYERLDALAGAAVDDPRIAPLAAALAAAVPDEVLNGVLTTVPPDGPAAVPGFGEALLDDYAPAQAEVMRGVMAALAARVAGRAAERGTG
ncbi:MerR family transcriptional regulator [Streptomyces sp. NPDC052042]|uniref:MerR family transcriptional regulator n=1 Tax=Streptomyces sp. NPDC052042 TaxID=3365683 RepID=UPI0037D4740F